MALTTGLQISPCGQPGPKDLVIRLEEDDQGGLADVAFKSLGLFNINGEAVNQEALTGNNLNNHISIIKCLTRNR